MNDPLERSGLAAARYGPIFGENYIGQECLFTVNELVSALGLALRPMVDVLDVGCGKGAFACHLSKHKSLRILGIDIDPTNVTVARAKARHLGLSHQVHFMQADFNEELQVSEHQPFEIIYALDALQAARDLPGCLSRLSHHLRPGGTFLATIWCFEEAVADLAKDWGFDSCYDLRFVQDSINQQNWTNVNVETNDRFVRRCLMSLRSLEGCAAQFEKCVGSAAYDKRLDLERKTALAATTSQLSQAIIRAEKPA